MFHVERNLSNRIIKGKTLLFFLFLIFINCGIAKQRIEIPDYLIIQNGKETVGHTSLNAFIFENKLTNIPFQQFMSAKYKSDSLQLRELWVVIDGEKYKLIFYDNDEFDKYFGISNFTAIYQETDSEKYGNPSKFIAVSMINSQNEDCLKENSLYQNLAKNYLKNLKEEYFKKNG